MIFVGLSAGMSHMLLWDQGIHGNLVFGLSEGCLAVYGLRSHVGRSVLRLIHWIVRLGVAEHIARFKRTLRSGRLRLSHEQLQIAISSERQVTTWLNLTRLACQ